MVTTYCGCSHWKCWFHWGWSRDLCKVAPFEFLSKTHSQSQWRMKAVAHLLSAVHYDLVGCAGKGLLSHEPGGSEPQHGPTVCLSGRCHHIHKGFRPTWWAAKWEIFSNHSDMLTLSSAPFGPFLDWQLEKPHSVELPHWKRMVGGGRADYWKQAQWTRWLQNGFWREGWKENALSSSLEEYKP